MRKILILFLIILITGSLSCQNHQALTKKEAAVILKEIVKTEFNVLEIREAPIEEFWEVVAEVNKETKIFYIHKNLRYIVSGQILDRKMKKDLTLKRWKEFRRIDVSNLSLGNAISMGEGKRKVYVFTDPGCSFCFQLHEELRQINNVQTYFFLYPQNSDSYEKATGIWCSGNRIKALEDIYRGKILQTLYCPTKPIDDNIEFGKRMFLQSTPIIIFQNGKVIEGYRSSGDLNKLIETNSQELPF